VCVCVCMHVCTCVSVCVWGDVRGLEGARERVCESVCVC
jgi:hypothetical protein